MRLLTAVAIPVLLLAAAPAQVKPERPPVDPQQAGEEVAGKPDNPDGTVKLGDEGGKAVPSAVAGPRGAQGFCHFVAACVPNRVLPGTAGTLLVTMVLEGDAVLAAPAPVTFEFPSQQGPVQLGTPVFRPAKEAKLAPAFAGRLAYDNYAIFEVPFTVDQGTPFGRHRVWVNANFELHQGKTGELLGRFFDRANADVEVGQPSVAALARGEAGKAGAAAASPTAGGAGPGATEGSRAAVAAEEGRRAVEGQASEPPAERVAPEEPPVAPSEREPLGEETGGLPILVVASAGGILLVVLLMLFLRRR